MWLEHGGLESASVLELGAGEGLIDARVIVHLDAEVGPGLAAGCRRPRCKPYRMCELAPNRGVIKDVVGDASRANSTTANKQAKEKFYKSAARVKNLNLKKLLAGAGMKFYAFFEFLQDEGLRVVDLTSELGRPDQTLKFSSSVKSKSIRLIFGRIDRSRRVLEAQQRRLRQNIRIRAH